MFVKVDECIPGSLLPSAVSSEHGPSLPQGGEGFSLACPAHGEPHPACPVCNPDKTVPELNRVSADQWDLFRPRFIQQPLLEVL